jgi:hypothetical protein
VTAGGGLFARGEEWRRARGQTEVREDPRYEPGLDDRGDRAHATGAGRTLEDVDEEDALQELRPGQAARAREAVGVWSRRRARRRGRNGLMLVWPAARGDAGAGV